MLKLPTAFPSDSHKEILVNGCKVIDACSIERFSTDDVMTTENLLLVVRRGKLKLYSFERQVVVNAGEAVFVRSGATGVFEKYSPPDGPYESVLIFMPREFIAEFAQKKRLVAPQNNPCEVVTKVKLAPELRGYVESIVPYFNSRLALEEDLIYNKIIELLFVLTQTSPTLVSDLIWSIHACKSTLAAVMEQNYTQSLPLEEFARLLGRSLASFKRDFQREYQTAPSQWLREKRLRLAHLLFEKTDKSVTEVCYEVGFVNPSHFSRAFKAFYGYSPNALKSEP
jgi:AraC family transcriptional regulator, exoenzyme S synthesis regulatory protein ExsA